MAESIRELSERIEMAMHPNFRERLLATGRERNMLWEKGRLPRESRSFASTLTEDLLDYGHTLLSMALRLRDMRSEEVEQAAFFSPKLERAFRIAGEAIEFSVHRGADGNESGFHRVSAAVAYHLARYSARAYPMLPNSSGRENLSPAEHALVELLRRRLDRLRTHCSNWLLDQEHSDERILGKLREDENFDEADACSDLMVSAFMRGLLLFDHAITTGESLFADQAKKQLLLTSDVAKNLNAVSHWWTATLARHLIDELWQLSLHEQLPRLPDNEDSERWNELRRSYIQRLRAKDRADIELWPSQLKAVQRTQNSDDNLVIALPTSAGKTRIAELCILRALAAEQRVIYVTPLRSLSAQVERDLADIFGPLGFSVSSLYASARGDTFCKNWINVATPEKLDFALRSSSGTLDNVGLIVLDESYMSERKEREVRYEVLVQRLLRRKDAPFRRIICLSALFPEPSKMKNFVAWICRDEQGKPVHSGWRPTRRKFGVLRWSSGAAMLEVKLGEGAPFVSRFIKTIDPPKKHSRRRKQFPTNKRELILAAAWRFVDQDKDVLVYCPLRKSIESLGSSLIKCIEQGVLHPFDTSPEKIQNAIATGTEWLGEDHVAVRCLKHGVVLHHGGLPRQFLNEVEKLLRSRTCRLTIASPTLAQGLNLSASVLLVHSIWRNHEIVPAAEFANVTGRAGRAFVDTEGLVVHSIWEDQAFKEKRAEQNWRGLLTKVKNLRVQSSILQLLKRIYERIAKVTGVPAEELIEYVTGNSDVWDFSSHTEDDLKKDKNSWDRDIASLDTAILSLLDAVTLEEEITESQQEALDGSLLTRELLQLEEGLQKYYRGIFSARAVHIWKQTTEKKRKGYHAAGVGLATGRFFDENLARLVELLREMRSDILLENPERAVAFIEAFAELVCQKAPFRLLEDISEQRRSALLAWMRGEPLTKIIALGANSAHLVLEALTDTLPRAMKAVQNHAINSGYTDDKKLADVGRLALKAGSVNPSVIELVRSGLSSREGAIAAAKSTNARFLGRDDMLEWLNSEEVAARHSDESWPTARSRHAWVQFYTEKKESGERKWKRETRQVRVEWVGEAPLAGEHVVLEFHNGEELVLTPAFKLLGVLATPLQWLHKYIVLAKVSEEPNIVELEYFGPAKQQA